MSAVRDAAHWLRTVLPGDGTPLDGELLRAWADRDGHSWTTVKKARERAGVGWRRRAWGGEVCWFVSGPPTPNYRPVERQFRPPKPRGHIEPVTYTTTTIGLCGACGTTWAVDGPDPGVCLTPGCNRPLVVIERDDVRRQFAEPTPERETAKPAAPSAPRIAADGLTFCPTCEARHSPDLHHCTRCRLPSMAPRGVAHAGCPGGVYV